MVIDLENHQIMANYFSEKKIPEKETHNLKQ